MYGTEENPEWSSHPSMYETIPHWIISLSAIYVLECLYSRFYSEIGQLIYTINFQPLTDVFHAEYIFRSIIVLVFIVPPLWKMIVTYNTNYSITDQRFIMGRGVFHRRYEEIELFRIRDISIKRTFVMRLFGLGSILIYSRDMTHPESKIKAIGSPFKVADLLRKNIYEAKEARGLREMEVT